MGAAFVDISTGEFYLAEGDIEYVDKLLQNFNPSEIVILKNKAPMFKEHFGDKILLTTFEDWVFTTDYTYDLLIKHFQTNTLKGFGVEDMTYGIIAAGAALHYLHQTQNHKIQHINKLTRFEEEHYVWLDQFTIRNLELIYSHNENAVTLLQILDKTETPMGSRMLRKWMVLPLKERVMIEERLAIVKYFTEQREVADQMTQMLKQIGDLERLVAKIATSKINPRELLQLARSLRAVEAIKEQAQHIEHSELLRILEQLNPLISLSQKIENEILEDPPVVLNKGRVFRKGVDAELDELSSLAINSKTILAEIQQREAIKTGITSLKIGFNNVFGYYLEVTNTHKNRVPEDWIRKQTLTNAERYITEELKDLETKILGAEENILAIEARLFGEFVIGLLEYIPTIQLNARLIAKLDILLCFATVSIENNYTKPIFEEGTAIRIKNGRHPVIEKHLPFGEKYIANDLYLDNENQQIIIITGPNMSGNRHCYAKPH